MNLEVIIMILIIVLIINFVMAGVTIFVERKNPASTWAWIFVIFFIPVIGFILYIILGKSGKRERVFKQKERYDYELYYDFILKDNKYWEILNEQKIGAKQQTDNDPRYLDNLTYLNLNAGDWFTENNAVERFLDGKTKFESLIRDIRNAKKFIHMEYYILRKDELGKTIISELAKKAADGVEVRLIYDGTGNPYIHKSFFRELTAAGGKFGEFLPPFLIRLNYRMHRKICVIDGEIGYVGGINIGNEYLGLVKRYGNWRDTHLRITGGAVDQLQLRFIMDWNFTSKSEELSLSEAYFPPKPEIKESKIQIVSSGPDTHWTNIKNAYFKMITEAEKNLYIVTPYFVPDDSILNALKIAALSGVDVRILIPANPDHFFVYWASMSYLGELLDAGIRCYQYEKGFIHSKEVLMDGAVASVGTANMDIRSFALNFEVNAFIYDKKVCATLEQDFFDDLEDSMEITRDWYINRPIPFKIKESISRLLSPIL